MFHTASGKLLVMLRWSSTIILAAKAPRPGSRDYKCYNLFCGKERSNRSRNNIRMYLNLTAFQDQDHLKTLQLYQIPVAQRKKPKQE
jgi:hypothetical protein